MLTLFLLRFPVSPLSASIRSVRSPFAHSRSTARGVDGARQRALQNPPKVTGCALIFPDAVPRFGPTVPLCAG